MADHDFENLSDAVGKSLPYFSSHADLVGRQAAARAEKLEARRARDNNWKGEIARETDELTAD
jgi:hypothetical protein